VKKTIFVLSYNDTNDLTKNLSEQNTPSHIFKIVDISQKIGFLTRLSILLNIFFGTVVFVLNDQLLADGDGIYLIKLALQSKKSLFLTFEPNLSLPVWLPNEKVNYLSVPTTSEDVREGLQAMSKIILSNVSFFYNEERSKYVQ